MPMYRRIALVAMAVMAIVALLPMAVAAAPPERVTERYLDANFDTYLNACISSRVWVEGATRQTTGASHTQTAAINTTIFVYDHCKNQEVLNTSGYAAVPLNTVRISPGLTSAIVSGSVPIFVPKGRGYTLDLSVMLTFSGAGKPKVNKLPTGVGIDRQGTARAQVILPALCGVVFCSDVNLTPAPAYSAQASQLKYRQS